MAFVTNQSRPQNDLESVVFLVDNKIRDLGVACLLAHHLDSMGVTCHLEPLESYRAALGAFRPGMIVFNHLTAGHLERWSNRLADMGVLTAVLPNEGICYDEGAMPYSAGRFHRNAHIDYFFCWNDVHKKGLQQEDFYKNTGIEVIGVPRFDFYFEPWSKLTSVDMPRDGRPRVLFCTNFGFAEFYDRPDDAHALFSQWSNRILNFKDYWGGVEAQHRARFKALEHLEALLEDGRFQVVLRPHPHEDKMFYEKWMVELAEERKKNLLYDATSPIAPLILDCDLEISCETCTTAMESWIARKPTIELIFEKHTLWYQEQQGVANYPCSDPAKLPDMVAHHLANPSQPETEAARAHLLEKWCSTPNGHSTYRMAKVIADAIKRKKKGDWSKLKISDRRRAVKLHGLRSLDLPYHFDPFLLLKYTLMKKQYTQRRAVYLKSIRPSDVQRGLQRIRRVSSSIRIAQNS